jgi:hypothetical protein
MPSSNRPSHFWFQWLNSVSIGLAAFGLTLVVTPELSREAFSLLAYGDPSQIDAFGNEAASYIALAHSVLGAVMFGWGIALVLVTRGPFRRGDREGWFIVAVSIAAWFVPDAIVSIWFGFWQNAVLNSIFALLFAAPLVATYSVFFHARD